MDPVDIITVIKETINNNLYEKLKKLSTKSDFEDLTTQIRMVNEEVKALRSEN